MYEDDEEDRMMEGTKYEVTELCYTFLGSKAKILYQMSLMGLMCVALTAYSQVFSATVAKLVPEISENSAILLFGAVVIPLSCLELTEQVSMQVFMTIVRFVTLGAMIVSSIVALYTDQSDSTVTGEDKSAPYYADVPMLDAGGLALMFSTALFSQSVQHSVPGIMHPLSNSDKRKVPAVFASALVSSSLFYVALGTAAVLYFGKDTESMAHLNWDHFRWGMKDHTQVPWVLRALRLLIVVFPALDTFSIFPLVAITLGNNLEVSTSGGTAGSDGHADADAGRWKSREPSIASSITAALLQNVGGDLEVGSPIAGPATPGNSGGVSGGGTEEATSRYRDRLQRLSSNSTSSAAAQLAGVRCVPSVDLGSKSPRHAFMAELRRRARTIAFRLVAAVPPVLLALAVKDLTFTLQLSGIFGVNVSFITPALLQYASRRACAEQNVQAESPYGGLFSGTSVVVVVLLFSVMALGVVLEQVGEAIADM